jgi:NTP pyrophosphatase (non-canonical NTP hydrolase)
MEERFMDPTLYTPDPEAKTFFTKHYGIEMPMVYLYEGYSRGTRANGVRCSICGKLFGHHTFVAPCNGGVAHPKCLVEAVKAGQVIIPRPAVMRHSEEMERQLRFHDPTKGERGWEGMSDDVLYALLEGEEGELLCALAGGKSEDIIHEAADVANIAMMIADNARPKGGEEAGEPHA